MIVLIALTDDLSSRRVSWDELKNKLAEANWKEAGIGDMRPRTTAAFFLVLFPRQACRGPVNLTPTLLSLKSGGPNSVTLAHGRHLEKFLGYQDTLPATCIKKASHVASGNAFRISGHETSDLLSRRTTQKKR